MSMTRTAQHALDEQALTVAPDLGVDALARELEAARVPGAVVLDGDRVVGVVTEMDLVFRNQRVHLPTLLTIFDAVIKFDPGGRTKAEFDKATGATVREIMSTRVVSVAPNTALADIASRMVHENLSMIPVVENGRLVGVVTRRSMMRAAFQTG